MSTLIDNRQMRIFISSTFGDMQEERDYLFNNVFPRIRKLAEQRDVRFIEIDLRWGVTIEESTNGQVMQICFDEIERCRPYFIGILGDRYGWCPDLSDIEKNPNIDSIYPWVKDCISNGKSITEMEMQLGALRKELHGENDVRAHFYIKANSQYTTEQQIVLKEAVRHHTDIPYDDYVSIQQLGNLVEKHLIELLDEEFPLTECSPFESEMSIQRAFLHSASFGIIPKPSVLEKLNNFLHNEKRYCVLSGQEGCGKTSTLAYWINQIKNTTDYIILYYFVGITPNSTCDSYTDYMRKCILKEMNIEKDNAICYSNFASFCYEACKNRNVLFIIDGVDNFEDSYIHPSLYLPLVPKNSKVILSADTHSVTSTDCVMVEDSMLVGLEHHKEDLDFRFISDCLKGMHPEVEWINEYRRESINISPLSKQDIERTLVCYFSQFGKKLTIKQIKSISNAPKSKIPSILALLMSFIRTLHNPDELEDVIDKYTLFNDSISFMDYILDEIETKYGVANVANYLLLLYVSRDGIPESDLRQICLLSQIKFLPLHFALEFFVKNISGYLKLKNATICRQIATRYKSINLEVIKAKIVDYYLKKGPYANCIVDECSKMWIFELPYQCYKLNRLDELYSVIVKPQVTFAQLACMSWSMPWEYYVGEISKYWSKLIDTKQYSMDIYFSKYLTYIEYSPIGLCYICMLSYICTCPDQTISYIYKGLHIYSSYGHKYDSESLFLMMMLAQLYLESENCTNAKQILIEALSLSLKMESQKDCKYIENILDDLSDLCDEEEYYDISINVNKYYKSLHIQKKKHIHAYIRNLESLVTLHSKHNRLEEALDCCVELAAIYEELQNKEVDGFYITDVNYAFYQYYCANILQQINRPNEAIDRIKIALSIYDKYQDNRKSDIKTLNIDQMKELCNNLLDKLNMYN